MTDLEAQIAELPKLAQRELLARYEAAFGQRPHIVRRAWLWRRFAWRLQAQHHGGLSQQAQQMLEALMAEIDLGTGANERVYRGRFLRGDGKKRLPVGSALEREWRGKRIRVHVVKGGFEWDGLVYRSLSAIAKAVTGTAWNGWAFFGLRQRKRA